MRIATASGRLYHFGYGWENSRIRDQRLVEYDGNWQGFQAVMSRYVDKKLTNHFIDQSVPVQDPAARPHRCRTHRSGVDTPTLTPLPTRIPERPWNSGHFLDKIEKDGGDPDRLSGAAAARLVPSR